MVTTSRKCIRCKKWFLRDKMVARGPKSSRSRWTCRDCIPEENGKKKSSTAPAGSEKRRVKGGAQTAVAVKKGTKKEKQGGAQTAVAGKKGTKKEKKQGGDAADIFRNFVDRIDKHTVME